MTTDQVHKYYDFILPLILEAGKTLKEVSSIETEYKKNEVWDVVTVYDRKIEETLIKKIMEKFPDHKYIGEEDSVNEETIYLTNTPTWLIDPIDGTANFIRFMPITCISVGLLIDKVHILGVVYNPYLDELFTAFKGEGAFLNGKPIRTSGCVDIAKSVFNYEISIARRNEFYYNLYMFRFSKLIRKIQGFRALGSAVLGLCYVACGRTDAYQCDGLYPWDSAAGALIVREAGGYVTDPTGLEFDVMKPTFLATATQALAQEYVEVEKEADAERENVLGSNKHFSPYLCKFIHSHC